MALAYHIKNSLKNNIISNVNLPASKSIANRVLILQALANDVDKISNLSNCDDTKAVIKALSFNSNTIDIGAAGTAMRFLTAFLSQKEGQFIITGSERMKNRPISLLVDALNNLGANIQYLEKQGYPPLAITGCDLRGGEITINANMSSQYISALLMIAPKMQNGLKVILSGNIVSIPYIKMTLELMKLYSINHSWINNTIEITPQQYKSINFTVESDWSAASYWFAVAALSTNCDIILSNLFKNSLQGDSQLINLFKPLGVKSEFINSQLHLSVDKSQLIDNYNIDLKDQPDLAQTLVVCCLLLDIKFCFAGLSNLKIKETDRIAALINECKKLGYVIFESAEGEISYNGERVEVSEIPQIDTYEDHRMAMAFAPAVMKFGEIIINEPNVVTKSYPNFWQEFRKLLNCDITE